jgi:hypothetical protein
MQKIIYSLSGFLKFTLFLLSICLSCVSCLTRAPTTYELDRRSGLLPPTQQETQQDLSSLKTNSNLPKSTYMPAMVPALVEKVWIPAQILPDGSKLDGTWMWIRLEPSRWLEEVDPGSASLTITPKQELKK